METHEDFRLPLYLQSWGLLLRIIGCLCLWMWAESCSGIFIPSLPLRFSNQHRSYFLKPYVWITVNIAKRFQSLSDRVSEETKAQTHPFLIPYLENVLYQSFLGIVWLQRLKAAGEMEGKICPKNTWSVGVPSSSCTMKWQLFHSLSSTGSSAPFPVSGQTFPNSSCE